MIKSSISADSRPFRMYRRIFLVCIVWACLEICGYIYFRRLTSHTMETAVSSSPMAETFHGDWVPASPTVHLYSAYADSKLEPGIVRIIGMANVAAKGNYTCVFSDETGNLTAQTPADISFLKENHGKSWCACFICCKLNKGPLPHYVSLKKKSPKSVNGTSGLDKNIRILHIHPRNITYNLVVCVSPIHDFIAPDRLVVWLELNLMLVVDHFIIYNYNASEEVSNVLRHYRSRNLLEILDWSMTKASLSHYFGQIAAINDCVYRSRSTAKYVGIFDMDEFIIPQNTADKTLMDMLNRFPQKDIGAFLFKHAFFPSTDNLVAMSMVTATKRCKETFVPNIRSKLIVIPDHIEMVGIHFVFSFTKGKKTYVVPEGDGLLHHYRLKVPGCELTTVSDEMKTVMNNRAQQLQQKLRSSTHKHIFYT